MCIVTYLSLVCRVWLAAVVCPRGSPRRWAALDYFVLNNSAIALLIEVSARERQVGTMITQALMSGNKSYRKSS